MLRLVNKEERIVAKTVSQCLLQGPDMEEIVLRIKGWKELTLSRKDLKSILGKRWLNDNVLDAVTRCIVAPSHRELVKGDKVFCESCYLLFQLLGLGEPGAPLYKYDIARRYRSSGKGTSGCIITPSLIYLRR